MGTFPQRMICFRPRFFPIDATAVEEEDSNGSTDSLDARRAASEELLSCHGGAAMQHCRGFVRSFVRLFGL